MVYPVFKFREENYFFKDSLGDKIDFFLSFLPSPNQHARRMHMGLGPKGVTSSRGQSFAYR
jgi:hypothetical protein